MYVAGFNMAGSMPNPDSNYVTDNWNDAVTYLVDTIDLWWDQDYQMQDWQIEQGFEFTESEKEEVDHRYINAHTDLHNAPTPPYFSTIAYDYAGNVWELWIAEVEGELDE